MFRHTKDYPGGLVKMQILDAKEVWDAGQPFAMDVLKSLPLPKHANSL